jgi:hypothetical protein
LGEEPEPEPEPEFEPEPPEDDEEEEEAAGLDFSVGFAVGADSDLASFLVPLSADNEFDLPFDSARESLR